jgi:hypothetical protein
VAKEIICKTDGAVILVDDEDFSVLSWSGEGGQEPNFIYPRWFLRRVASMASAHKTDLNQMVSAIAVAENLPGTSPAGRLVLGNMGNLIAARTTTGLYDVVGEGLKQVIPEDIVGWFEHAGLSATHG